MIDDCEHDFAVFKGETCYICELELKVKALSVKFTERDAIRLRSEASNYMLGDDEFLKMMNKEIDIK